MLCSLYKHLRHTRTPSSSLSPSKKECTNHTSHKLLFVDFELIVIKRYTDKQMKRIHCFNWVQYHWCFHSLEILDTHSHFTILSFSLFLPWIEKKVFPNKSNIKRISSLIKCHFMRCHHSSSAFLLCGNQLMKKSRKKVLWMYSN